MTEPAGTEEHRSEGAFTTLRRGLRMMPEFRRGLPATFALADEVVWLENGRALARGTHEELLAAVPGYAALVRAYSQTEGVLA